MKFVAGNKMKKMNSIRPFISRKIMQTYAIFLFRRVEKEHLHVVSGYLSYVTLMSLVPLIVVMLSVMTAFPIFSSFQGLVEEFVYTNFVPASGDVVQQHLTGFVSNASKMSAVAISFLFLFALLLISAIDKTLNRIWKITEKRRVVTAFSMYWMVLTLGPVLVGSSIAVSSYIVSLVSFGDQDVVAVTNFFLRLLPIVASFGAFLILYLLVPNKVVPFKFAAIGALVAALLFEFAKKGFALYVTKLPSYEAIYGALASIPILFVWVYLSWLIVLFGAVITVSLQDFEKKLPSLLKIETEKDNES